MPRTPSNRTPAGPVTVLACLLSSACTMRGPDFKRPEVPWLNGWSGGAPAPVPAEAPREQRTQTEEWWRNFNAPVLDRLVAEAQRLNPGVRTAGMRIMEARAQLGIAVSAFYPQRQKLTGEVVRAGSAC